MYQKEKYVPVVKTVLVVNVTFLFDINHATKVFQFCILSLKEKLDFQK
jgi:hypothetical protein